MLFIKYSRLIFIAGQSFNSVQKCDNKQKLRRFLVQLISKNALLFAPEAKKASKLTFTLKLLAMTVTYRLVHWAWL